MKKVILTILFLLLLSGCANTDEEINLSENSTIQNTQLTDQDYVKWNWFIRPGEYKDIRVLDENFIAVKNESGNYGVINNKKELIIDHQFFNILNIKEGIATVLNHDKNYLYIDKKGNLISKTTFEGARDFQEGYAAVKNDQNKWGFIDTSGKLVIEYQFDEIFDGFYEGYAAVKINNKWRFIDNKGAFAFPEQFDDVHKFSSGYAAVKNGEKWGFIDYSGNVVIDFQYDDVGNFSEEKAAVRLNLGDDSDFQGFENWAYINKNNEVVIDFHLYSTAEARPLIIGEFEDGYASVTDIIHCLIDSQGNTVLTETYFLWENTYGMESGIIASYYYSDGAMLHRKYGFIDMKGTPVIPFIFKHTAGVCGNLSRVLVEEDGVEKVGVIQINL